MTRSISRFAAMVFTGSIVSVIVGCDSSPASDADSPGGIGEPASSWRAPPAAFAPQVLAQMFAPFGIAVDGTNVYVSRATLGPLVTVPVQGGSPADIGVLALGGALAVDERRLYWTDGSSVFACEKADCAGSTVDLAPRGAAGMTLSTGNVYWTTRDRMTGTGAGQVMKVDKDGGQPADLAAGNAPHDVAVDASYVYWIQQAAPAFGVVKTPIAGGASVQLAVTDPVEPMGIALDADNVYFMTGDGKVLKVSKNGGPTIVLLGDVGWFPHGLATDGTNVYVGSNGGLFRVPVGGGPAAWLFPSIDGGTASDIALDDTSVYIADRGRDAIIRVAK
jgi:hypothetical protein